MSSLDYWKECLSITAEEANIPLTDEQLIALAEAAKGGHENYGMAFYTPPSSDRFNDIRRESEEKYKRPEAQFNQYRASAEQAVKTALRVHHEDHVSIGQNSEVLLHGGRTEQIQ